MSKPFAQAVNQLESDSVIVILVAIKLFVGVGVPEGGESVESVAMVQMGMISFSGNATVPCWPRMTAAMARFLHSIINQCSRSFAWAIN